MQQGTGPTFRPWPAWSFTGGSITSPGGLLVKSQPLANLPATVGVDNHARRPVQRTCPRDLVMLQPPPPGPAAVLVAHPYPITREGVKAVLKDAPDFHVIGEVGTGAEVLALARAWRLNLVISTLGLPDVPGPELATRLREVQPAARLLVLTHQADRAVARELLAAGAAGLLLKQSPADDLLRAVRVVASGETYLDPAIAGVEVDKSAPGTQAFELSDREVEVVRLVALGYSNKQIAVALNLNVKSVDTYKARARGKLGITSRVDLVQYVLGSGLIVATNGRPPAAEQF
jgi:DNA-binding NarL/FixJ family response regulator